MAARIGMRLDQEIKQKAEKATALLGFKSLTEYIVRLMDADATRVIAEHENMTVENDMFDEFLQACERAEEPNKALCKAVRREK